MTTLDIKGMEAATEKCAAATPASPAETGVVRWSYVALAVLLTAGFFCYTHAFWEPVNGGVDQNGYLVGGKMLADHGSMSYAPVNPITGKLDPYLYVGEMWIGADLGTPTERYYPKYPIGLPAIFAGLLKIGGAKYGPLLCYLVDPVMMTLGILGTFFIIRTFLGSFSAFCGTLIVATTPDVMGLTNEANSHAGSFCCAVWGMFLLISWWKRGGWWRAMVAGFLCGYAVTIRYPEGLVVIPILVVIAFRLVDGPRTRRQWMQCGTLLAAWALPIAVLVTYNLVAFGAFTGYATTHESDGFSFSYFRDNWPTVLHQMNDLGLYFIFPLALLGLGLMFRWNWRVALFLAAWIVPCLVAYAFYYWAPDGTSIAYLRFFLTIFPPLTICGLWFLLRAVSGAAPGKWAIGVVGAVTMVAILVNLDLSNSLLASEFLRYLDLHSGAQEIAGVGDVAAAVPAGSEVFAPPQILHYLQFNGDNYLLYNPALFNAGQVAAWRNPDPTQPRPFQLQRAAMLFDLFKGKRPIDLLNEEKGVIDAALNAHRRVFFIASIRQLDFLRRRLAVGSNRPGAEVFDLQVVSHWDDSGAAEAMAINPPDVGPRRRPFEPPQINPLNAVDMIAEVHRSIRPPRPRHRKV